MKRRRNHGCSRSVCACAMFRHALRLEARRYGFFSLLPKAHARRVMDTCAPPSSISIGSRSGTRSRRSLCYRTLPARVRTKNSLKRRFYAAPVVRIVVGAGASPFCQTHIEPAVYRDFALSESITPLRRRKPASLHVSCDGLWNSGPRMLRVCQVRAMGRRQVDRGGFRCCRSRRSAKRSVFYYGRQRMQLKPWGGGLIHKPGIACVSESLWTVGVASWSHGGGWSLSQWLAGSLARWPPWRHRPPFVFISRSVGASQGTFHAYQSLLNGLESPSVNGKTDSWFIAPVERSFGCLTRERTEHGLVYPTPGSAQADAVDSRDMSHNSQCCRLYLAYISAPKHQTNACGS